MNNPNRRTFVMTVVAGGSALAAARASAQAAPVLSESDPQAVALGYKADSTKVDKTKYPQHVATQMCASCNFFQGKPTDAMAPCQLFGGKQVSSKGMVQRVREEGLTLATCLSTTTVPAQAPSPALPGRGRDPFSRW